MREEGEGGAEEGRERTEMREEGGGGRVRREGGEGEDKDEGGGRGRSGGGEGEDRDEGGGRGREREEGREREREEGRERDEMLKVLLSIISAQQTSLLHTSHDELTELPASEEGGERVRGEGGKGSVHATENSAGLHV